MKYFSYPCKDCSDRVVGCHSTCEKYKAAKVDHKEKKEQIYQQKKIEDGMDNYVFSKIAKIKREKER